MAETVKTNQSFSIFFKKMVSNRSLRNVLLPSSQVNLEEIKEDGAKFPPSQNKMNKNKYV